MLPRCTPGKEEEHDQGKGSGNPRNPAGDLQISTPRRLHSGTWAKSKAMAAPATPNPLLGVGVRQSQTLTAIRALDHHVIDHLAQRYP